MAYQLRAVRYRPSGHRGRPHAVWLHQCASCGCLQINGDLRAGNGAVRRLDPRQVAQVAALAAQAGPIPIELPAWTAVGRSTATHQTWSSARVGGDQTGPTRAPNRRLPAARADNPLRAPISAVLTGASAPSSNLRPVHVGAATSDWAANSGVGDGSGRA